MNENELKMLWQTTNEKLVSSLKIHKENTESITKLKVNHLLTSMKPVKLVALAIGVVWVLAIGSLLGNLLVSEPHSVSIFFVGSAGVQILLTAIAIGVYVYQLDLIRQINLGEPVFAIQEQLAKLRIATLNVTRLLFLQLPLWTTFYWHEQMFSTDNLVLWLVQGTVTVAFTCLAFWLFANIKYENRNKKWFRWIFSGAEWQPILQAMNLLEQLEHQQAEQQEG